MPESNRTIDDLLRLVRSTYANPNLDLLERAYAAAETAHRDKTRLTGDAYIVHPLAVAYKLAEMGAHLNVVAAGLLHDVIEDSDTSLDEVRAAFGDDIAGLVDSVTKLKKVKYQGADRYVENLRKMFLAMASDVRVVFIKFADRLHNLKTLYAQPRHKQERIARETLEIYAPIAGRLGMSEFKGELEDLSFAYLFPKEYERVHGIIAAKVREKGAYVSRVIDQTEKMLSEAGLADAQVHGRVKRLYSLHKKLIRHNDDLSKVYDLIAVRVIVRNVEECYAVLGLLHQTWNPVQGRIKDYLAQPKPNGYQSLHTTVFTSDGETIEFQIRTREMHELAEYGVAAHWRYKEAGMSPLKNLYWMEELAKIQKELSDKKDFLEQLEIMKIDVFKDRIFVFTPNGDVIDLPESATPVDFAYAIHTEIGNKCSAARVNGHMVNLDSSLVSNDVVEIVTDKNRRGPNQDWLKFVRTHHARSKIKDATRSTVKGWLSSVIGRR
jgi:GTP pyrophosphokinase